MNSLHCTTADKAAVNWHRTQPISLQIPPGPAAAGCHHVAVDHPPTDMGYPPTAAKNHPVASGHLRAPLHTHQVLGCCSRQNQQTIHGSPRTALPSDLEMRVRGRNAEGAIQRWSQKRLPPLERPLGGDVWRVQTAWGAVGGGQKRLTGLTINPPCPLSASLPGPPPEHPQKKLPVHADRHTMQRFKHRVRTLNHWSLRECQDAAALPRSSRPWVPKLGFSGARTVCFDLSTGRSLSHDWVTAAVQCLPAVDHRQFATAVLLFPPRGFTLVLGPCAPPCSPLSCGRLNERRGAAKACRGPHPPRLSPPSRCYSATRSSTPQTSPLPSRRPQGMRRSEN